MKVEILNVRRQVEENKDGRQVIIINSKEITK